MKENESPDSAKSQNLVKALQSHITGNYYLCTNEVLAGLGQMYVADERFVNNINKHADGTAAFICKAIEVYCADCDTANPVQGVDAHLGNKEVHR